MSFTACLVLVGLMGTVCGIPVCPETCELAHEHTHAHHPHVQHVSDLRNTSVAPWNLVVNVTEGREPQVIQHAMCKDCTVEHMIAKPIFIQISVFQRIRRDTNVAWCKCPYELAVGCTCVNKQQQ